MANYSDIIQVINDNITTNGRGEITPYKVRVLALKQAILDRVNATKLDPDTIETTIPAGGMLPNKFYSLGTISAATTLSLAGYTPDGFLKEYKFQFSVSGTPSITWDDKILKWLNGETPVLMDGYSYQVSVINGLGICEEYEGTITPPTPSFSVSPLALVWDENGGDKTLTINASGEWSITLPSWVSADVSSGSGNVTITLTAQASQAGHISENLVVTSGGQSINVDCSQSGSSAKYLTLDPNALTFGASASSLTFEISSNTTWHIGDSEDNWFHFSQTSGSGDATITVTVDANTGGGPRSASWGVYGIDVGEVSLNITQNA